MYRSRKELKKLTTIEDITIRDAIKRLDDGGFGILMLLDDNEELQGILTDSDFRKIVLKKLPLTQPLTSVMNKNFVSIEIENFDVEKAKEMMLTHHVAQLPILKNRKLVDLIEKTDTMSFSFSYPKQEDHKDMPPVLIMAGGKGTRLSPITRVIPKPLVPVGEKTILEAIIENFRHYGYSDFIVSLNYKGEMIKSFFNNLDCDYNLRFLEEEEYLGTIGALKLMENKLEMPIFVSNCDVIINANYREFYKYHMDNQFSITLVGSFSQHVLPYGVCEIDNNGELVVIKEKPTMEYLINVGMYLINPECLQYIPNNERYDMTSLIETVRSNNHKVGVYPIRSTSWVDIGQLNDYKQLISEL